LLHQFFEREREEREEEGSGDTKAALVRKTLLSHAASKSKNNNNSNNNNNNNKSMFNELDGIDDDFDLDLDMQDVYATVLGLDPNPNPESERRRRLMMADASVKAVVSTQSHSLDGKHVVGRGGGGGGGAGKQVMMQGSVDGDADLYTIETRLSLDNKSIHSRSLVIDDDIDIADDVQLSPPLSPTPASNHASALAAGTRLNPLTKVVVKSSNNNNNTNNSNSSSNSNSNIGSTFPHRRGPPSPYSKEKTALILQELLRSSNASRGDGR
jgi:hypothetical protein